MADLEKHFDAGARVDAEVLAKAGLIRKPLEPLKILGTGELTKAMTVAAHRFSASAAEKIAKAGGAVERVS